MPAQSIALGITQLQHVLSISLAFSPASRLSVVPIQSIHSWRCTVFINPPSITYNNTSSYVAKVLHTFTALAQVSHCSTVAHFQPWLQTRFVTRKAKRYLFWCSYSFTLSRSTASLTRSPQTRHLSITVVVFTPNTDVFYLPLTYCCVITVVLYYFV